MAGISRSTYEHATAVLDEAPESVIEATRRKDLSINAAYEVTKLPESQQAEIAKRIEQGEAAKSVISEVKSRNRKSEPEPQTRSETVEDITVPSDPETLQSMPIEEYDEHATEQDEECTRIDIFKTLNSYNIIYAVPTWEGKQSADELLKLPEGRVADENCALLLKEEF